jgi:hypothetical protein
LQSLTKKIPFNPFFVKGKFSLMRAQMTKLRLTPASWVLLSGIAATERLERPPCPSLSFKHRTLNRPQGWSAAIVQDPSAFLSCTKDCSCPWLIAIWLSCA